MSAIKLNVENAIDESEAFVFTSTDFLGVADRIRISNALRSLCLDGKLIRISIGMYAKAEISELSGKPYIPVAPMEIALEAMSKLGVEARLGSSYREYNEGRSTQVPAAAVVDVGKSRIKRKIKLGQRELLYERST